MHPQSTLATAVPRMQGHARALRNEQEFWARVDQSAGPDGCWPWLGHRTPAGYGSLRWVGSRSLIAAHRVAYDLTHPVPLGLLHCLHRCDNPPCCNPAHLWAGTKSDNAHDALRKGRMVGPPAARTEQHARGERVGTSKLNEAQVRQIIVLYRSGASRAEIARRFGLTLRMVRLIGLGQQWAHVFRAVMEEEKGR